MSRAYWVKLSSSVTETIKGTDRTTHRIELDAVLPEGEMREILEGALAEAGWEQRDEGSYQKTVGEVSLTWDLDKNEVEAAVESSREVSRDLNVEGRAYSQEAAQRNADRQLKQQQESARDAIEAEQEQLQKKLTTALGENEEQRVREINGVLQKAYTEGLKRKARRMGNVTSIQEGTSENGEYELTITVSE